MSRNSRKVFKQIGVLLPIERDVEGNDRVMQDSQVLRNDNFMKDGFLYVKGIQMNTPGKFWWTGERMAKDQSVILVQSVSTGELFINKLLEAPWDSTTGTSFPPGELRASTYRHAVGDSTIDFRDNNGQRRGVLPSVPCFNKLRFWQELDPRDRTKPDCVVYSLFFEFCNGGKMDDFIKQYQERGIAIPEHFIWLVAEQLFLALVAMKFGTYLGQDGQDDGDDGSRHGSESDDDSNRRPNNWARIYHRDLAGNNVFINYPPRGPGRIPRTGLESNAFPEIVVGDFGNAGIEGDDVTKLPMSIYAVPYGEDDDDGGFLEDWEDTFSVGEVLRTMSMTHVASRPGMELDFRPNCGRVQDVNQEATAPPYSDELIGMLQRFEYPNMERGGGVRNLRDAIHTTFPSPQDLRDTLLPQARARVAALRRPADRPAGYFDSIDVSWTKPEELMPFSYIMEHATEAGDGPDGRPPPPPQEEDDAPGGDDDDGGSDDGTGDGSGDGSGDVSSDVTGDVTGEGSGEGSSDVSGDVSGDVTGEGSGDASGDGSGDVSSDVPGSGSGDGTDLEMSDPPPSSGPGDDGHDQPSDGQQQPEDDEDDDNDNDNDESSPVPPVRPPQPSADVLAMRTLRCMHKWNIARPRYELVSLEFGAPVILRLKVPP